MPRIGTVLCPVDFSPLTDREVDLAVEVCRTFDARLVLHHNLDGPCVGLAKRWEWQESHRGEVDAEAAAEARLGELVARIPGDVDAEAGVSRGGVVMTLLYLAERLPADLLVIGTHGRSSEEHLSVTERIIDRCPCPVLTLHGEEGVPHSFRLHPQGGEPATVLVPTDFSDSAEAATDYAFALVRSLGGRLHLLHIGGSDKRARATAARLEGRIPEDLAGRVEVSVAAGPVDAALLGAAERLRPQLIVSGRHAHGLLRRYFTHDTARELLHRASCPVWFVAPGQAA